MKDFEEVIDRIPEYEEYLTVDELRRNSRILLDDHPGRAELLELGKSRNGEAIEGLKIGEGKYNALVYGFPNPEEPFGGLIIDFLSRELVENDELKRDLDYTWYLIKCIDPDGARQNEGFQKGPFTPLNFTLNYFRTPHRLTGEMAFPYRMGSIDFNQPTPETRALMGLMDVVSFDFISSLHMMKWGV